MANITSANAVFLIAVPDLAIVHQVQGFAADAAFDIGEQDVAQNLLGVDGKKSSGWIQIGRAHVNSSHTDISRMPSSA